MNDDFSNPFPTPESMDAPTDPFSMPELSLEVKKIASETDMQAPPSKEIDNDFSNPFPSPEPMNSAPGPFSMPELELETQKIAFENDLQNAEIQYLRTGLRFWALPHSFINTLLMDESMIEAFTATLPGAPYESANPFLRTLESLQGEHTDGDTRWLSGCYVLSEVGLDHFQEQIAGFGEVLDGLSVMAEEIPPSSPTFKLGFRENNLLWDWVMQIPMVKAWIANGVVSSEEAAFVKAINLGDEKVRRSFLWMAEAGEELQDDGEEVEEMPEEDGMEGVQVYAYQNNNLVMR